MAKLTAKLKEGVNEVKAMLVRMISKVFSSKLTHVSNEILPHIKNAIKKKIQEQPEYKALNNPGVLSANFGLRDGHDVIEKIVDHWISQIYIRKIATHQTTTKITSGLEILTPPPQVLLSHPDAKVKTDNGQELPWLEWLLFKGGSNIILGYRIQYGLYQDPPSRSKQAIMVEDVSGSWGVPEGFQGTSSDNFIFRSIVEVKPTIDAILHNYLNKQF